MFDKWEETLFHLDSWQLDPLRTSYKLSHLQGDTDDNKTWQGSRYQLIVFTLLAITIAKYVKYKHTDKVRTQASRLSASNPWIKDRT